MMKPAIVKMMVLVCAFVMAASGALEPQVVVVHTPFARGLKRKAVAEGLVAPGSHEDAACRYTKTAKHHHAQAEMQEEMDDKQSAADSFLKAADMQAAAGEQARMHAMGVLASLMAVGEGEAMSFVSLVADYADLDKQREQGLLHDSAAFQYLQLAGEHVADGEPEKALAMNRAAAEQYETAAEYALACGDHENAAARYCYAARIYRAIGNLDKARAMSEATARHFETSALEASVEGDKGRVAGCSGSAASVYDTLGEPDKARPLWHLAAAKVHHRLGDDDKAQSMREAANGGLGVSKNAHAINDSQE